MKVGELLKIIPKCQDFDVISFRGDIIKSYSYFHSREGTREWIEEKLGDKIVDEIISTYDEDIIIIRIK